MEAMIVIALLALNLFGPGWSSPKKAYWEWQLGHKLEGYQEHRLARGEQNPYGCAQASFETPELWECSAHCVIGGECTFSDCHPISK